MKKVILYVGGGLLLVSMLYALGRDPDLSAFKAQREAWHQRCDAYVGVTVAPAQRKIAEACAQELNELTAYAKQKGWM